MSKRTRIILIVTGVIVGAAAVNAAVGDKPSEKVAAVASTTSTAPEPTTTSTPPPTTAKATTTTTSTTSAPPTTQPPMEVWMTAHGKAFVAWNREVAATMAAISKEANALNVVGVASNCIDLRSEVGRAPRFDSPDAEFNSVMARIVDLIGRSATACISGDYQTSGNLIAQGNPLWERATAIITSYVG